MISGKWSLFQQSWTTEIDKKPVWPEYWKMEELESVKATLPVGKWNAQWMQEPTSEEGALIKREWWKNGTKNFYQTLLT